jgi:hypothetical protein
MTSMVDPMVLIYVGWKQPKISCMLATFGNQFSNTMLKMLNSSICARCLS